MPNLNSVPAYVAAREEIRHMVDHLDLLDRDFRYDPLYGIAMLKVSFNLRPQRWLGFDDILKSTLRELEVDESELDRFVNQHRQGLEMACKMIGI